MVYKETKGLTPWGAGPFAHVYESDLTTPVPTLEPV